MSNQTLMFLGAAALRGVVVAPPGRKLIVADLSNIEGRVLAWIAGEEWKLQAFRDYDTILGVDKDGKKIRKGPDLYNVTAASILGGDPWKVSKKDRNVFGKVPDLASGYQGGVRGYQTFARAYNVRLAEHWETIQEAVGEGLVIKAHENFERFGKDQIPEMEISITEWLASECCKLMWRQRHPKTTSFWYNLQDAMIDAINEWGRVFHVGQFIRVKGVSHKGQRWLCIALPSGRYLTYFNPRLVDGKVTYEGEATENEGSTKRVWTRIFTHGGKATGNCLVASAKVLTSTGAKRIVDVRKGDLVWDGAAWVATDGVIAQGRKAVGDWLGTSITSEHLIHDGRSWKPVTQLDECSTRDALVSAASSVRSPSFAVTPETMALQTALARAEYRTASVSDNSGGDKACGAVSAQTPPLERTADETTTSSPTTGCERSGLIDTSTWCDGAPCPPTPLGRTTVSEASRYTPCGSKTAGRSFGTSNGFPGGTNPALISTDETTNADTCLEICGSCRARSTQITGGATARCSTADKRTPPPSSDEPSAQSGSPPMQLDTILTAGARQIGLWQSTTKVEEVFDLLNCGPNNRFTILTDEGPVVVHNCCQTIARDILAPALLDAEQDGYLPVLSVHDEGLTETPDTPNYTVDRLVWHLAKGRSWTKGLPLAAEGFETYRYFKE